MAIAAIAVRQKDNGSACMEISFPNRPVALPIKTAR